MASLSAHLRRPERHARLPFRSDCPICRLERLAGEPPNDRLVSPRVPAALAAGVLAVSTTAPGVAVAAEPDQQHEGTAAPQEAGAPGDGQGADFDPGGPASRLPDETPTPAAAPANPNEGDGGPAEQESDAARTEPVADEGDAAPADRSSSGDVQTGGGSDAQTPAEPGPGTVAQPSDAPVVPVSGGPGPAAVEVAPAVTPQVDLPSRPRRIRERVRRVIEDSSPRRLETRAVQLAAVREAPQARGHTRQPVRVTPAARWYVVRPGDSLWAIATRLLGYEPGSHTPQIDAKISGEVQRLWGLNRNRLRSGDPSLIYSGERLRLK
jgi:LysM domain